MRSGLVFLIALLLGFGLCAPGRSAWAQDGGIEEQTREIAKQLNCPTCAGRNLADCPTDTCNQWKTEISTQLRAGRTPAQVSDYFLNRFGPGVLQEPPREGGYLLAWIFPFVVFFALCAAALMVVRRSSRSGPPPIPAAALPDRFAEELERQVRED